MNYFVKTLATSLAFCITALCTIQVSAMTYGNDAYETQKFEVSEISNHDVSLLESQVFILAENESKSDSDPKSGDLVVPGASEAEEKEKKCVTVCDEWGRDCIINPKTGQRKCRRMCKSFGQECI